MRLSKNSLHIFTFLSLLAFITICSIDISAQDISTIRRQANSSNSASETTKEIEMMRQMLQQRRQQQEEQRKMLQELQQALSTAGGETTSKSVTKTTSSSSNSTTVSNAPHYVTSESKLSQLEALEKLSQEQKKHDLEMQAAQKQIDMLKKQLEIANNQLDNCQRGSIVSSSSDFDDSDNFMFTPARQVPKKQKQGKPTKSVKTMKASANKSPKGQPSKQNIAPQQQQVDAERQKALEEIEMMRQMLKERREQQEQQRKMLQDLQQTIQVQ